MAVGGWSGAGALCAAVLLGGAALAQPSGDDQAAPAPPPAVAPEDQAALDAYYDCARAAARRLEASGEAAEAIGRATRVVCRRQSGEVLKAWIHMSPGKVTENTDRTLEWGDTVATAEVVAIRLCRVAKDCRSF